MKISFGQRAAASRFSAAEPLRVAACAAQATTVQVWGATIAQKRAPEPGAAAQQQAMGIELTVLGMEAGKGMLALTEDKVPASALAEPLTDVVDAVKRGVEERDMSLTVRGNLRFHKAREDGIVAIVHRDNPVRTLGAKQVRAIYSDDVKNRQEEGGADLPVHVVGTLPSDTRHATFRRAVPDGAEYSALAVEVKTRREAITIVSKYSGAIGSAGRYFSAQDTNRTQKLNIEGIGPMARAGSLVTREEPRSEVEKVIDWLGTAEAKTLFR